ncbi:MAG TPA: hypothetical protein VF221_19645 [Chloroflexota bacterium]
MICAGVLAPSVPGNVVSLIVAAILAFRFRHTGGQAMLRMMSALQGHTEQ